MNLRKNDSATDTANSGKADDPYVPDGHGRTDEQIRADVHELLTRERQTIKGLALSVRNGIVTLQGELDGQVDAQRLAQLIGALPSVRGVEDKLRPAGSTTH
jgi:osmotically-inducible protein OsmY